MVVYRNGSYSSSFRQVTVAWGKHSLINDNYKLHYVLNISTMLFNTCVHNRRRENNCVSSNQKKKNRFNVTNMDEPSFLVELIDSLQFTEDQGHKVVIYSMNQKGRSSKVTLKNMFIGERTSNTPC